MNMQHDLYTLLDFKMPNKLRNYMFLTIFLLSMYGYFKGASIIVAIGLFISVWYFCYCFDPTGPLYSYKMKKEYELIQKRRLTALIEEAMQFMNNDKNNYIEEEMKIKLKTLFSALLEDEFFKNKPNEINAYVRKHNFSSMNCEAYKQEFKNVLDYIIIFLKHNEKFKGCSVPNQLSKINQSKF